MRKVLICHNEYGSDAPSGENDAVACEVRLLQERGHTVVEFRRRSDEIRRLGARGAVIGGLATPWNPFSAASVRSVVRASRPDVVHIHNTFPLLSPSVLYAIPRETARVMTLHNYRLFCAAGIPMRGGVVCTVCLDSRSSMPAVVHGCYRGSSLATLPLAMGIGLHRAIGTWRREVDVFIALTDFQRHLMIDAGLPADRVRVKPNFFPGSPEHTDYSQRSENVVFVGRLSEEKGLRDLLSAWALWGSAAPELTVVGDGPLRTELERFALDRSVRVRFWGRLPSDEAAQAIARSRLLVVPSRCYEGFPLVLREAFAFATPTVVSNLGPLPALVSLPGAGVTFAAGDPDDLLAVIVRLWNDSARLADMSRAARSEFELKYSEDVNYELLTKIYDEAIAGRRHRQ